MAVEVIWGNAEKTLVIYRFEGAWTWEEFFAGERESRRLLSTVEHKVNLLLNFLPSTIRLPDNAVANFRRAAQTIHPNRGNILIVNRHTHLAQMVVNILRNFSRIADAVYIVDNLEEAYAILGADSVKP